MTLISSLASFFTTLMFIGIGMLLLWGASREKYKLQLLGRRLLALDVPEFVDKLRGPSGPFLSAEEMIQMAALLEERFPELQDAKKMVKFMDSRGLTLVEIRPVMLMLNEREKKRRALAL